VIGVEKWYAPVSLSQTRKWYGGRGNEKIFVDGIVPIPNGEKHHGGGRTRNCEGGTVLLIPDGAEAVARDGLGGVLHAPLPGHAVVEHDLDPGGDGGHALGHALRFGKTVSGEYAEG